MQRMINKIYTFIGFLLLSYNVQAQDVLAEVVQISQEIVKQIAKEVPTKICQKKSMPVYGTVSSHERTSTSDVIVGAIFGGLLGNQIGSGTGQDAATVLGAIAGADIANKKKQNHRAIIGHKDRRVCSVSYENQMIKRITGYNTYIKFADNIWQLHTRNSFSKGDYLRVNVTLKESQ